MLSELWIKDPPISLPIEQSRALFQPVDFAEHPLQLDGLEQRAFSGPAFETRMKKKLRD